MGMEEVRRGDGDGGGEEREMGMEEVRRGDGDGRGEEGRWRR